jgi:phosphatidate cytidylyltransferase
VTEPPTATAPQPATAPRTPRAGRNLPAAIGVGVALAALVVVPLAVRRELLVPVIVVAIAIGAWEMHRALLGAKIAAPLVPVLLGAVSMVVGAYVGGGEALVLTFGLTCVGILLWRAADGVTGAARDVAGGVLLALYPCFLAGFASLMLAPADGHLRVTFFILVTVFSDIGGYAVGVLLGKHPMAPSLSPKKSWEGFAGSVGTCAVVGAVSLVLLLDGAWWAGALIGAVVAATATVGDLVESSIKRDLGIKDMGSILPGHGGLMDRLDSLVLTAPVVWGLLLLLVGTP